MLAYVFWHRPAEGADAAAYEAALLAFHASLAASAPAGFQGSVAFERARLPWMDAYEDWYLVEDWAALGVLNDAAVDARHRPPHDAVARGTAAGAGAVYALESGPAAPALARAVTWSGAPVAAGDAHWRRQLVLGPAPQYCTLHHGPAAGALPRAPLVQVS